MWKKEDRYFKNEWETRTVSPICSKAAKKTFLMANTTKSQGQMLQRYRDFSQKNNRLSIITIEKIICIVYKRQMDEFSRFIQNCIVTLC